MRKRLMVVDDTRIIEVQMEKILTGTEYEIAAYCQNGEEAIARYEDIQPDIVTMDIIMPGIDGLETAEVILEEHPEAKIVMVSSLAYEETIREAEAIGVKAFVFKPVEKRDFIDALETALEAS